MKAPRADILTNLQLDRMEDRVQDMIDDTQLSVAITFKGLSSVSYVPATGTATRTDVSKSVRAIRRIVGVREANESGGKLQVGDRVYLIEKADLTS